MNKTRDWPLDVWLKIAVTQLGISPSEFWKISLVDWFVLTRREITTPITKAALIKMEEEYDTRK